MSDAAAILRANGIVADPALVIQAAREAGLPLAAMAPKLIRESYGGRNVIGHDAVDTGGVYAKGGDAGNRGTTDAYLRWRGKAGARRNRQQGWGPSQLTWAELQDQAEAEGGLHNPLANMRVGARELARCLKAGGGSWREAGARYNGGRAYASSSVAAQGYGRWLESAVNEWERRLAGVTIPAGTVPSTRGSSSGRRMLEVVGPPRMSGDDVRELQEVLRRWYDLPRTFVDSVYGPATAEVVERLQRNSRPPLTIDGKAGPQVYRALGLS